MTQTITGVQQNIKISNLWLLRDTDSLFEPVMSHKTHTTVLTRVIHHIREMLA